MYVLEKSSARTMKKIGAFFLVILITVIAIGASNKISHHSAFDLLQEENVKAHYAKQFRRHPGLHVRHNIDFQLALKLHEQCDKPFVFNLIEKGNSVFSWTQIPRVRGDGMRHFELHVNRSIPVGQYKLITEDDDPCSNEKKAGYITDINVMFNPLTVDIVDNNHARFKRQPITGINSIDLMTEYMQNDCGYIWAYGFAIPWRYAVGSAEVTQSRNRLMQLMTESERTNQVLYSRALTRLISMNVLDGRWDGRYGDGVDPSRWVGSDDIFHRWLISGLRVRYGQCWVFAGLLTSLLRASGIPARTVTNYNSHHDRGLTDDGNAVLRQYDNIRQNDESIWNFHVWSEAWLARPDLGQPANWNALDATPQEPSPLAPSNPFQCGPAYVPYIKANRRTENFDTLFILAEVNAVEVCPITSIILPGSIGFAVVTKKPGKILNVYDYNNAEFITNSYKVPLGLLGKRASEDDNPVLPPPYIGCERDGGMRLNITRPSPRAGESFVLTITGGNVSAENTVIRVELRNYMGESLEVMNIITGVKQLNVTEMSYLAHLRNSSILLYTVGEYNNSGEFVFHDSLRVRLLYDPISVEAVRDPNSTNITLTLTYTNPLSVPMTGVVVSVASPDNSYVTVQEGDISARATYTTTVTVDCGDEESDVVIPISLDSDVTQSAYGTGWVNCGSSMPSGSSMPHAMTLMQIVLISLLVLVFAFI